MKLNKRGFTFLELLLAMFIFTSIVGGVAIFAAYYFNNYSFSFEENQAIGLAQTGLTTMAREIREARQAENGAWPLEQTDDNALVFYADVTNDGRADRVRYFLNGTNLQKGVIQPSTVPVSYTAQNETITTVASYVDTSGGSLFRYYNGNWPGDAANNPLTAANRLLNTRYIAIRLKINISSTTKAQPFELQTGVQIRSMKTNL